MSSVSELRQISEVSRALASRHYDRAFVLVSEWTHSPSTAAAFLLESGVPLNELPRDAVRAITESAAA